MPLTPEQKLKVQAWFKSKKVIHTCPSCGLAEWGFGDIINGNMIQTGCMNCGYIRLYLIHESMKPF